MAKHITFGEWRTLRGTADDMYFYNAIIIIRIGTHKQI